MKKDKIVAIVLMILVIIIWGISFLSIKTVVRVIPPMSQGAMRFFIASIILYFAKKKIKPNEKIKKEDYKNFFLIGAIGIALYFYFENSSMLYLPASIAGILIATLPIFIMISEIIFYKEKMSFLKLIGVVVSFVGVYLILSNHQIEGATNYKQFYLGLAMMMGAIGSWVIYSLIMRRLSGKYSSITITYYQFIIGTICFIPFTFQENILWNQIDNIIIMNLLYLSVICSALAFLLYNYVIGIMGASQSSVYLNLMPLITMIASVIIFDEILTTWQIIGSGVVIISIYIVENAGKFENIYMKHAKILSK